MVRFFVRLFQENFLFITSSVSFASYDRFRADSLASILDLLQNKTNKTSSNCSLSLQTSYKVFPC